MSAAPSALSDTSVYVDRMHRARAAMERHGVDVLLVSVGRDLPYLTGYEAMPLERLTMLVVPKDGDATLVIPRLEAPRVIEQPGVFGLLPWGETENPVELTAGLVGHGTSRVAIGDTMWARFLVELLPLLPGAAYERAVGVMGDLRMKKDAAEIEALRRAEPRWTGSPPTCRRAASRSSGAPRPRSRPISAPASSPKGTSG